MQAKITKILIALSSALLLLVLLAYLYLHFQRDNIKQSISTAVNEQIDTHFTHGDFELSLISQFPFVRARLKDVYLRGRDGLPFIYAEKLDLRLDLRALMRREYELKSVELSGGNIYIIEQEDGSFNYDIFGESDGQDHSDLNLLLRKLELEDMEVVIDLKRSQQVYKTYLPALSLSGGIASGLLKLDVEGSLVADYLKISGRNFMKNKEVGLTGQVHYDLNSDQLEIPDLQWKCDEATGRAEGWFNGNNRQYRFSGELFPTRVNTLMDMLPQDLSQQPYIQNAAGIADARFSVSREENHLEPPTVNLEIHLKRGRLMAGSSTSIEEINGRFLLVQSPTSTIRFSIPHLTAEVDGSPLTTVGEMEDWGKGGFSFKTNGLIPIPQLNQFLHSDTAFHFREGFLHLEDMNIRGKIKEENKIEELVLDGRFRFSDCSFLWNDHPMTVISGRGQFIPDENTTLEDVQFEAFGSSGKLSLFGPDPAFLFNKKTRGDSDEKIDLNVRGNLVELTEIVAFFQKEEQEKAPSEKEGASNFFPPIHIQLHTDTLLWKNASLYDINGIVAITDQGGILSATGLHAGGKLDLDGHFSFGSTPHLSFRMSATDMAVDQVLEQWDHFDQDFILSHHIEGHLQGHIWGYLLWITDGGLDERNSEMVAAIEFNEGVLNEFPLLQDFSTFINEDILKRIRFSKVTNVLWMRDGTIYLPGMFIQSNAMNLTVAGAHTLDHQIRYGIRLNAGQVLAERIRGRNDRLHFIPARKSGFFNLHYLLTGHTSAFDYRTSTSEVQALFTQTDDLRKRAMEKLQESFDALPYFSDQWSEEEVAPPEFPDMPESGTGEYLPGFDF